jgi:hypothetical protein
MCISSVEGELITSLRLQLEEKLWIMSPLLWFALRILNKWCLENLSLAEILDRVTIVNLVEG